MHPTRTTHRFNKKDRITFRENIALPYRALYVSCLLDLQVVVEISQLLLRKVGNNDLQTHTHTHTR